MGGCGCCAVGGTSGLHRSGDGAVTRDWHPASSRASPDTTRRIVTAFAASVAVFVTFAKVFSPQYLVWLLPLVPLVGGRRGAVATGLLGLAALLTQLWFPSHYWELVNDFAPSASWLVLARDLLLLAIVAVLVLPVGALAARRQRAEPVAGAAA